jgi:hypothetical protein
MDGFGPDALGHRVPPIKTPIGIALQVARLTMGDDPLVPEGTVEAMLKALADKHKGARDRRESFEITIVARGHDGRHRELRCIEDRRLG